MTRSFPGGLDAIVSRFELASPSMLGDRRLLRRVDTKFFLPTGALVWILNSVARDYRILAQQGQDERVLARYRTIYLDTPDLRCFHDHRCGRLPRQKVRLRRYLDRDETYFEIKSKQVNGQTNKYRLALEGPDAELGDQARRLVALHTSLPFDALEPTMVVDYHRMTLLAIHDLERVTIDVGLDFRGSSPGFNFDHVAIVEVKQPALCRQTPIMQALRTHRVYPSGGSKYCTAMVMARPGMPTRHVRSALRAVERIQA